MKQFLSLAVIVSLAACSAVFAADSPPIPAGALAAKNDSASEYQRPAEALPATGKDGLGLSLCGIAFLGIVIAAKVKAPEPFIATLENVPAGFWPGSGLVNGSIIHGVIEAEGGKKKFVVDTHLGPSSIPEEYLRFDELGEPEPEDYKALKGEALEAELARRGIDGKDLKVDEKRAALVAQDIELNKIPADPVT